VSHVILSSSFEFLLPPSPVGSGQNHQFPLPLEVKVHPKAAISMVIPLTSLQQGRHERPSQRDGVCVCVCVCVFVCVCVRERERGRERRNKKGHCQCIMKLHST